MAGFAQVTPGDGSSAESALQVKARLVVLDVTVVDRNGNFVSNLDRSKFHIVEDKTPQTIRNFDPPSGHQMPIASQGVALVHSTADLPKIGNAPVNVLVIDELNTPFMQIGYAQQMMERYLKQQPEVLPVPTLFIAAGNSRIAMLHDFTQSRADLIASVHKHVTDQDFEFMVATLHGGRQGATGGMSRTLGALLQLADSMRGITGRKNVIWVGTGYKRAMDSITFSSSDEGKTADIVRMVTNKLLDAHITLYTIDPSGPVAPTKQQAAPVGSPLDTDDASDETGLSPNMHFESFAYSTGGRVLFGRNDIETEIKETTTEGSMYYTLAYSPTTPSDADRKYRKIKVTVDDPSLRVVTRDGYFGARGRVETVVANTEKSQPRGVRFDLVSAARTTMVYTGLHSDAVRTRDGYLLRVKANDLRWDGREDGSRISEITAIGVCYNAKGKELGQHAAELKEELDAKDVVGPESRGGLAFPMPLPAGTTRVRLVLRDAATGNMGSVNWTP